MKLRTHKEQRQKIETTTSERMAKMSKYKCKIVKKQSWHISTKGKYLLQVISPKYSRLLYPAMTPTGMYNKHLKLHLSLPGPLILKHTNKFKCNIKNFNNSLSASLSKYIQNSSFLILHCHLNVNHYHFFPGLQKESPKLSFGSAFTTKPLPYLVKIVLSIWQPGWFFKNELDPVTQLGSF